MCYWAALEALDVRLLRHPLACSWRLLSTSNTTTAVALSLYRKARRTSSSFRLSLLVFSLSLCVSFETRFVFAAALLSTLPALPLCVSTQSALSLCSRLCWVFVSAQHSSLLYSVFCSRLCSRLWSRRCLLCPSHLCLGYASRSLRGLLHVFSRITSTN